MRSRFAVPLTFTLTYPTTAVLPDDAEMYVGFDDGGAIEWQALPASFDDPHNFTHTYVNPGSYDVELIIRNLAGSQTFTVVVSAGSQPSPLW